MKDSTITVSSSPDGPVYTVKKSSGEIIVKDVALEEVQAKLPKVHKFIEKATAGKDWAGLDDKPKSTEKPRIR